MKTPAPPQPSTPTPAKSDGTEPPTTVAATPKPGETTAPPEAGTIPDAYTFTAPDGFEIAKEVVDEATPILKELKIDQPGAQRLFDLFAKHSDRGTQALIDHYEDTREGWRKDIITDREIGNGKDGLTPEASANIAAAKQFLPPALRTAFDEAMNLTGAGDHPAFVKAMSILGATLREGKPVAGAGPAPTGQRAPNSGPKSAAAAMYPNLPSIAG